MSPASRRRFLHLGTAAALPLWAATPARAAAAPSARQIALVHLHTRERVQLAYATAEGYVDGALATLDRFLRDHYNGEVGRIDPRLFDLLHLLRQDLGAPAASPFEIISGYRSPGTNEQLRRTRGGAVATRSLHMDGRALDIRLPGVPLADLRDAALSLRAGGVGYYPREQFVHVDTGRVRAW